MPALTPSVSAHLASHHGVATPSGLESLGITREQTKKLVARGDLVPVLPGAYRSAAVRLGEEGRCAAVSAAHPDSAIAGPTAGRLWGFRRMPRDERIHVIAPPASHPTRARWVVPYRTAAIHPHDVVERADGIRLTTRSRTAFDLARWLSPIDLASVIEQVLQDGTETTDDLRRVAADWISPRRAWATSFLRLVDGRARGGPAESHLEVQMTAALEAAGVRGLVRQFQIDLSNGRCVRFDFAIPEIRWALEVDGFPRHFETDGAESDARRDVAAMADGWRVRRVVTAEMSSLAELAARLAGEVDQRRRELLR